MSTAGSIMSLTTQLSLFGGIVPSRAAHHGKVSEHASGVTTMPGPGLDNFVRLVYAGPPQCLA